MTPKFISLLSSYARKYDVNVFAFGLLKDFRNKLFDGTKRWIEEADSLREMKTICELCDRKATCNALENKNRVMVRETINELLLATQVDVSDNDNPCNRLMIIDEFKNGPILTIIIIN